MVRKQILICIFLLAFCLVPANAQTVVELSVQERGGVERRDEPLTTGLPLPPGMVESTDNLRLVDEKGNDVPTDIQVVNRWWRDDSLKWVHLHFKTSIPPGGHQSFSLMKDSPAKPAKGTLKLEEDPGKFVISTGPLKLSVRKSGFNGVSEAWLHGEQLVRSHEGGLVMKAAGEVYRSSLDEASQVKIEKKTPLYLRLRAEGYLQSVTRKKGFRYLCRVTAFAGLSRVEVQVTVFNTMGPDRKDKVALDSLQWEIPTVLARPRVLLGGDQELYETQLQSEDSVWIHQKSSDEYQLGGRLTGKGEGKSSKPLSTGWIDAGGATAGVSAGVRWFWQLHPKSLQVDGNGRLLIGLYPEMSESLDIYTGVSRTHDMLLYFHSGADDPKRIRDVFAGFQKPLFALAPLRWYTRQTEAFGKLVDPDPRLFGADGPLVKKYLDWWDANFQNLKRARDGRHLRGIFRDAYGWLEFGDSLHWAWEEGNPDRRNLSWDSNYYDFPHASLLHFLLTGRWDYYDYFVEHSRHLADIHLVHHDPDPMFIGSNRYCPPTDHVRIDPGRGTHYSSAQVYVSNTFNHHKTQSLFEKYLLTGDPHALDSALKGLDYAFRYHGADEAYNQPRGPGHQLLTLLAGYELTGQRKYLDRCVPIIEAGKSAQEQYQGAFTPSRGAWFQFGITLEGLRSYHEVTGDESVAQMIQKAVDFLMTEKVRTSNLAHACGFLFARTGDRRYLDYGIQMINRDVIFEHPVKNTALGLRSTPYFLYYLQTKWNSQ